MSMTQQSNNSEKLRYFVYPRKSSESDDRQVLSIDSQIEELQKIARQDGLEIVDILPESKSAKAPGRPVFNQMIERIQRGEANAILCWKLDRLARNPVDGAQISWMLQQGALKHIQTYGRGYTPNDNVLLMSVEFGMANQFIRELSSGVKRGFEKKRRMGWFPGVAPSGYINTPDLQKGTKEIKRDPERFPLIRKMWDMMLTGAYTPPKILDIATEEWGYRTLKRKKSGGSPMAYSTIYKIFTNPFYYGWLEHPKGSGQMFKGSHDPMVTEEEFDHVQTLLGRKGKPRQKRLAFAFTSQLRCEECGCHFTAEKKTKYIKSTKETKVYTYYHCTRRRRDFHCSQRKVLREEDLEIQIDNTLRKINILPEFLHWGVERLRETNDQEIEDRSKIYETQHKTLTATQTEIDNLTKMRYRELIDDAAFLREKNPLQVKIEKLKEQLRDSESRAERWVELTEQAFRFMVYARKNFDTSDLQIKKEILLGLGSNPTVLNGKLNVTLPKWYQIIADEYPAVEKDYQKLEPNKLPMNTAQTKALASIRTRWYRRSESNRQARKGKGF